jgi:hypothetical protein
MAAGLPYMSLPGLIVTHGGVDLPLLFGSEDHRGSGTLTCPSGRVPSTIHDAPLDSDRYSVCTIVRPQLG